MAGSDERGRGGLKVRNPVVFMQGVNAVHHL